MRLASQCSWLQLGAKEVLRRAFVGHHFALFVLKIDPSGIAYICTELLKYMIILVAENIVLSFSFVIRNLTFF